MIYWRRRETDEFFSKKMFLDKNLSVKSDLRILKKIREKGYV